MGDIVGGAGNVASSVGNVVTTAVNAAPDAAAGTLHGLSGGISTKIAGRVFGFDPSCADFGTAGRIGEGFGFAGSMLYGGGELAAGVKVIADRGGSRILRGIADRFADERGSFGGGNSITTKLRRTPSTDGSESLVIRERTPGGGQTVQVVHQVGKPLPGGGVLITHKDIKHGPLPGSQLHFPEVNP